MKLEQETTESVTSVSTQSARAVSIHILASCSFLKCSPSDQSASSITFLAFVKLFDLSSWRRRAHAERARENRDLKSRYPTELPSDLTEA